MAEVIARGVDQAVTVLFRGIEGENYGNQLAAAKEFLKARPAQRRGFHHAGDLELKLPARAGAPGTVTYGVNLQAWCLYLIAAHQVPVHRCAELIEALTGAVPSPGFVHAMIARAAAAVAQANKLIR